MTTRKKLSAVIRERCFQASTGDRGRVLDEIVAVAGDASLPDAML